MYTCQELIDLIFMCADLMSDKGMSIYQIFVSRKKWFFGWIFKERKEVWKSRVY